MQTATTQDPDFIDSKGVNYLESQGLSKSDPQWSMLLDIYRAGFVMGISEGVDA